MTEEILLLKQVCQKLEQANIPYMLTGSLAGNFYTVPRMTRDIDIVLEIAPSRIDKFLEVFQADFYLEKSAINEAIKYQSMFNVINTNSALKIDFIIRKDSLYRDTEFQRRRQILLDGDKIWIVSPEDLILSKLFWAKDSLSERQLRDTKNLIESIKNLDTNYLHKWINSLELNHVYQKLGTVNA
jgi:hypothetical protein